MVMNLRHSPAPQPWQCLSGLSVDVCVCHPLVEELAERLRAARPGA